MKHTLLCVDDEIDNVEALERLLRKKYHVLKATGGEEALKILEKNPISLIISDQKMPKMTGVQFLEKSQKIRPEALRILLTGYTDIESVIDAINSGQIYRYLTKPWDPVDLTTTVDQAIEKFELTQELQIKNKKLEKAYQELKTLDEAKSQFMILINHELKTPLTVMSSFLQLLQDTSLDEEQKKYLKRILSGTDRLQNLVKDALELVSAEARHTQLQPKKSSLKELVYGLDELFMKRLSEKSMRLEIQNPNTQVVMDTKVIRSILERLLDNAIKFGDVSSIIFLRIETINKDRFHISIQNKGPAMDPLKIEKILKPFSLDENIMHHSKGTGLGLSICQSLLKLHQSELKLSSQKDSFRAEFELSSLGV